MKKIEDNKLKVQYFNQSKYLFSKNETKQKIKEPKILDKFNQTQKEVTLQDLQYEVNQVKQEIK